MPHFFHRAARRSHGSLTWPSAALFSALVLSLAVAPALADPVCVNFGDSNGDCRITASDAADLAICMQGPDVPSRAECDCLDMDRDGTIDIFDFYLLQFAATGSGLIDACVLPARSDEPGTLHWPTAAPSRPPVRIVDPSEPRSVYLFGGEYHTYAVDLSINSRGVDFVWARKYRSKVGPNTAMGNGWDFSYNVFIEQSGPDLLLHDGNTREDLYLFQPDGTWASDEFFREINQEPDGSYVLKFADSSRWQFFAFDGTLQQGRLQSISDRNDNTLQLEYNPLGQLTVIHDTLDTAAHTRDVIITYNLGGFVETLTDWTGRQVIYTYYEGFEPEGSAGDLKSVRTPTVLGTPHGNDYPAGKTTVYTYTKDFPDPRLNHNLLTITDPKGQTYVSNEYAATFDPGDINFDRVVSQTLGNPGEVYTLTYAELAPDQANGFSVIKCISNDRMGNVSESFYDFRNRIVLFQEFTGRANPTQPTTDTANRPVAQLRLTDPAFYETRFEYNVDSLITRVIPALFNPKEYVFEKNVNFDAARRSRGNLRFARQLPGPRGGDQTETVESFIFDPGINNNTNFLTAHTDARGHTTTMTYDAQGNLLSTVHRIASIVENWEYNPFGQVTAKVWPSNGATPRVPTRRRDEFTYYTEADGAQNGYRKQSIVDALGFAITTLTEYDALGRPTREVDPRGHDTLYTHNELDQVVRLTSREVSPGGARYERDTYYDANDNVVRVDLQNVSEAGVLQPNPHFTTIHEFDVLNFPTTTCREEGSFDVPRAPPQLICAGLPETEFITTEFQYDPNRNRTLVRFGEAVENRQLNNVVRTLYDERNIVFRVTHGEGDANQTTSQFDYDLNRNVVLFTRGLEDPGTQRIYEYFFDGYERLVVYTDPMGNRAQYGYDQNFNRLSVVTLGELEDLTDTAGSVRLAETDYQYDNLDRLTTVNEAFFNATTQTDLTDGASTRVAVYNDNSQVLTLTDDTGDTTTLAYDSANRLSLVTDPMGNTVTLTYDANSNRISVVQVEQSDLLAPAESFTTTSTFDGLDRQITAVDNVGNTSTFAFDSRNNLTLTVDAKGNRVLHTFDGINRALSSTRELTDTGDGGGSLVGTITTAYSWDDTSRLITQTDDNGHVTTYTHDPLNRRTVILYADGTTYSTTYDLYHNTLLTTDANASQVLHSYDANDRLIAKAITLGPGVSNDTTFENLRYDGLDRVIRLEDDDSVVLLTYDSLSNLTSEDLNGRLTLSTYDGDRNQLTCAYPGGRHITTVYDPLDRLSVISDDATGQVADFKYVGPGRVTRRQLGNNTDTDYTYDGISGIANPPGDFGVKRKIRVNHTAPGPTPIADHRFLWDTVYNKSARANQLGDGTVQSFNYDSAYRLLRLQAVDSVGLVSQDTTWTFDGVGNRLDVLGGFNPGIYTLDATPSVPADAQVNQYTAAPGEARTSDEKGNLGTVLAGGATRTLTYDYLDRLVAVNDPATGTQATYAYDSLSRRIEREVVDTAGTNTTLYFYDRGRVVEERDETDATSATYVYGIYIDEVLNMRRGGNDFYYHADDLYNVMALTDAAGNVVERYEYDAYGTPLITIALQSPDGNRAVVSDFTQGATGEFIADDVSLSPLSRITAMRWWGIYDSPPTPSVDDFLIQFYSNNAGNPSAVLQGVGPLAGVSRTATGRLVAATFDEFIYAARITPALVDSGAWLQIANNITESSVVWAWETGADGNSDLRGTNNPPTDPVRTWVPPDEVELDAAYELFTDTSSVDNPYLFTGRRYDPETGYYYYRSRYLDPVAGRFVTRDTIGIWGDADNLGNGYTYVGNNPWTMTDPSGRYAWAGFRGGHGGNGRAQGHGEMTRGNFTRRATGGLGSSEWGWGGSFADVDDDGAMDLLHIGSMPPMFSVTGPGELTRGNFTRGSMGGGHIGSGGGSAVVYKSSAGIAGGGGFEEFEREVEIMAGIAVNPPDPIGESNYAQYESYFTYEPALGRRSLYRAGRLTPKPSVTGPQTAVVTKSAGEEIYTDEYGRVKVQFNWDREGKCNENSTRWIHVAQQYAGSGFADGDPDRPIITGRVYQIDPNMGGTTVQPPKLPDILLPIPCFIPRQSGGHAAPTETITLSYGKIKRNYQPQDTKKGGYNVHKAGG